MVKRLQKNKVCNRELDNTEECVNWQPYNKISKLITNNKGLGGGGGYKYWFIFRYNNVSKNLLDFQDLQYELLRFVLVVIYMKRYSDMQQPHSVSTKKYYIHV